MKKILSINRLIRTGFVFTVGLACLAGFTGCSKNHDPVTLTFSSWRTDDVEEMNRINAMFTKLHPEITVSFQPFEATGYDGNTLENLAKGAAATTYIKWAAGSEYARAFMDELPGFFTYLPGTLSTGNPLADEMLGAAYTADLTVRLMSEKLNSKSPTGDSLMDEALKGLMLGTYTPESAAAYVQSGLETR